MKRKAYAAGLSTGGRKPAKVVTKMRRTPKAYTPHRRAQLELKVIDQGDEVTGSAYTSDNPVINYVSGCAQGTDYDHRVGRRYLLKSFTFKCWQGVLAAGVSTCPVIITRTLIIEDRNVGENAGVPQLPAITDVLEYATVTSPLNLNNRDRFKVHVDQVLSVGGTAQSLGLLNIYRKINVEAINGGSTPTTAAITGISSGAMYIIFIGSGTTAAANCNAYWNLRFRFTD